MSELVFQVRAYSHTWESVASLHGVLLAPMTSRCEKLRTPKTASCWQWVSWCSRCEHIHTPESRHHRRHALLHPRRDLHPPGFLCQAQNEIKVLPAPNRYVPTIMSTETAFYRRNFVISSVCPGKRTSAGQNSFDKTHWTKLIGRKICSLKGFA